MANLFKRTLSCLLIGAVVGAGGTYAAMNAGKIPAFAAVSSLESGITDEVSSLTSGKAVSTESGTMSYYFPRGGEDAEPALVSVIDSAKESLDIAIYSFTDQNVASAVIADKKRGVTVRVITDRECADNSYQKKVLNELKSAGIPVKYNTHSGLMHLKVTIADDSTVTTGSFNYTKSAEEKNDEVLVVINDGTTAKDFKTQFTRMWNDTKDFSSY
jgi:phosphatidylserine/phosphatidylglycerophosphate/cardiolipin synthase-like enzyme